MPAADAIEDADDHADGCEDLLKVEELAGAMQRWQIKDYTGLAIKKWTAAHLLSFKCEQ